MTQLTCTRINALLKTSADIAPRGEGPAAAPPTAPVRESTAKDDFDSGERGLMRPGHEVRVDQHRTDAVLVKSSTRLKPGTRTDLQLLDRRRILRGEIERCQITRLQPLRYESIFVFDQSIEMPETHHV